MTYKMKGHTLPGINQRSDEKDDKFLKDQNEPKVKSTDYLTKTPSIVASKSTKEDYDADNDEETKRINTTPNTRPPMFSDADAHRKAAKSLKKKKK